MKQLTCEMCGSTDLLKQDGMFVCQNCGTKYTVDEAKKLMVEGTVKIDNSEKLRNLYTLARQAKDSNDAENAVKYYDLIKQEDPRSWEACFYNVYFRAAQTRVMYIQSAANSVKNCLENVFELIRISSDSDEEKKAHIREVSVRVTLICSLLESSSKSTFVKLWSNAGGDSRVDLMAEYTSRALAASDALFACGNLIEQDYKTDTLMMKTACELWKSGIDIWKNSYAIFDNHAARYSTMKNSYVAKIQKYQGNYSFTRPQYSGFPSIYITVASKNSNSDFGVGYSSSGTSSSSSGGCYVATAVYGSYDCPQVWTLRRFLQRLGMVVHSFIPTTQLAPLL